MEWFDPYEIRARIAPTVVVSFPLIVTLLFTMLSISDSIAQFLSSGVVLLLMVYTLSFLVRHLGKRVEPKLWERWGGAPSTRVMRWSDTTFDDDLKGQLRSSVEQLCGVKLKSREEEAEEPKEADRQTIQAFRQVRAIVRREDPDGVWFKHNAEYGFQRNLLGSMALWLVLSVLGALVCAGGWYIGGDTVLLVGSVLNVLSLIVCIVWWRLLPTFAQEAANRYAESVWTSFLVSAKRTTELGES